jgi:hypothetical protein
VKIVTDWRPTAVRIGRKMFRWEEDVTEDLGKNEDWDLEMAMVRGAWKKIDD